MSTHHRRSTSQGDPLDRRSFLQRAGMGFGSLALAAMLHRDGFGAEPGTEAWSPPDGRPHFVPRAKSVIWLFMVGGASHVECFDPKPALKKYAAKTIEETPFKGALTSPFLANQRVVAVNDVNGRVRKVLYPMQVDYQKRGASGLEISDAWPQVGSHADDLCLIRSMWTTDNNHGAQLQFHTGRHHLDGFFPTIGSWVHYGLGSLDENLPQFVVLGRPLAECCGGMEGHRANYLGPQHDGVPLAIDPERPLPFMRPEQGVFSEEQRGEMELLARLGKLSTEQDPRDAALSARIKSYELAFRMQTSVPRIVHFEEESLATQKLYGLDNPQSAEFGKLMLASRRLVEQGVRFVQVYHGSNGTSGNWDAHSNLQAGLHNTCSQVDQPIAALLTDLKQRGLLDETLVVWASEFGRTPGSQNGNGRDHSPYGFTVWMAGGGIRGGIAHGATDEIGFHAVENRHYVTDVHATILHQLGLDPRRLTVPGHKRLERDYGSVIADILA